MKLKHKLLIGYGVSFFILGWVVVWAVINMIQLGRAAQAILSENYRSIIAAENMIDALERQDSAVLLMMLGDKQRGFKLFQENQINFLKWSARANDNITIPGEHDLLVEITDVYQQFCQSTIDLLQYPESQEPGDLGVYQSKIFPIFDQVREKCISLRDLNEKTMYGASESAERVSVNAIWSTILVAGLAFLIGLAFILLFISRITSPLKLLMSASRKISEGEYLVTVPVKTQDEIGNLANEFNQMAEQLDHFNKLNIEQVLAEKTKGEAILSSIEDGLIIFDENLEISGINPSALAMCPTNNGFNGPFNLKESPIWGLIKSALNDRKEPQLSDEQRIWTVEQGNQLRHYLFSVAPILGRENNVLGVILLLRDVTGLRELERLKSEFVMAASHELRTPLTGLAMSIDLLKEHLVDQLLEPDLELLEAAHEEVHRMKILVNDLLDLSRLESGQIGLELETVEIGILFNQIREVFENQAALKGVILEFDSEFNRQLIQVDVTKITWVLTNLVSNALRYVGPSGLIKVATGVFDNQVQISVWDNGPGIAPEDQIRIFQKFGQVPGRKGGTGLGLAICREIVRAHGGAIWVESTLGNGSTFTFTLPKD